MSCGFRSPLRRIDSVPLVSDDVFVEGVLNKRRPIGLSPKAAEIGLVIREEQLLGTLGLQCVVPKLGMRSAYLILSNLIQQCLRLRPRSKTRCSETTMSGASEVGLFLERDCRPRCELGYLPGLLWHTPRTRQSSDRHRRCRCRGVRTQSLRASVVDLLPPDRDRDTPDEDTCIGTSCRNA